MTSLDEWPLAAAGGPTLVGGKFRGTGDCPGVDCCGLALTTREQSVVTNATSTFRRVSMSLLFATAPDGLSADNTTSQPMPAADRTAVIAADGIFSYQDLDEATSRVAAALCDGRSELGEERVAFLVPPGFAHVAIVRGIWRAGGIAVPMAISHPASELDYVVRDAQASIVVADPSRVDTLEPIARATGARLALTTELLAASAVEAAALPSMTPSRRALIVYTSGTTGKPKGVVTTHGNLAAQINALIDAWEWTREDRTLLVLPLHHVHGIVNVVGCALSAGATCEMLPTFDAETTWARLASGEISVFTAVPTVYHRLITSWEQASPAVQRARSEGCRRARLMMSGSAALPVQMLERWRDISGHTLLERYGMTEIGMALSNPLRGVRRPGTVGSPLPGVKARIADDSGNSVDGCTPGELEIRGDGVFLEYWRRPEETRRAFRDGWFRTGDVAVVEDGTYRLLGRTSVDIIKTGGYKVSALEVEEVIRAHPAVSDCAVIGVIDSEWGERVSVAVELRAHAALSLDDLQSWTKPRLAPYKIPRELHCLPSLPRNALGKVVKPELAKLLAR
jgi:malonyl-CoA/methylmalonyl-CoA synthetase